MSQPSVTLRRFMGQIWQPWRDLADRKHIVFGVRPLPAATGGAVHVRRGDRTAIVLDPGLTQAERRCALAHELVHDERGGGCDAEYMPVSWGVVARREERIVDDVAVHRLVPADELIRVCVELEMGCTHVESRHIAEHFHVTEPVARRALELQDRRLEDLVSRVSEEFE